MPSIAVNVIVAALLVAFSDKCACNQVESEVSGAMVPMILPDGRTFYAYIEPKSPDFYRKSGVRMLDSGANPNSAASKRTAKLVEIWNLSTMNLELLDRGNTPPGLTRASLPVRGNDRSVGPVEGLTQVFAVGVPGDTLCLKKSVGSNSECLTEFPIPDEGPIVFDCNKDYSAITDYMRDPECGGLHKFLPHDLRNYYKAVEHLKFKNKYRMLTGREYFVGDPNSISTPHSMWPVDYYGQEHHAIITSEQDKDTQFRQVSKISSWTLQTLSAKPRVFKIQNFLTESEIEHMLTSAKENFHENAPGKQQRAVLHREMSSVNEAICSRASDMLRVDGDNSPSNSFDSIYIERMSKVVTDFDSIPLQDTRDGVRLLPKSLYMRYATIFIFLNDPPSGGELRFPLSQDEVAGPLSITPEKGTAIQFYSMLPDGNMDHKAIWEVAPAESEEHWFATMVIAQDMSFY